MIRKSSKGYTVFARTGRPMGTYRSLARAQERLGQLEAFKANRAPLGRMSPTVRSQSKDGKKGYYVRAKSGRSMGWYATKREAEMRMGQLKAQGAKHFTETRRYSHSPSSRIARVLAAKVVQYPAGKFAVIEWVDSRGKRGSTEGFLTQYGGKPNTHLEQLLARAKRELR